MSDPATTPWPALDYESWAPTKKTLQMCSQMLGKARLALAPPLPEWLHACLYLDARGFTTGPMPWGDLVVTMRLDLFDSAIAIDVSDGRHSHLAIGPDRCVADVWADFHRATTDLGVELDIWEKPQELADTTPFSANHHNCIYDAEQARAFHQVLCMVDGVFEEFRSQFFGRSGIQFWWGAFDFAVLLFNGKHDTAPDDRGYIMRYDLDAEMLNAGFWPGDDNAPTPGFYAYLSPLPDGCEFASIEPVYAGWVESMGEWMMSYESVRSCDDPKQAIRDFVASVYRFACESAGWDQLDLSYVKPAPARRG